MCFAQNLVLIPQGARYRITICMSGEMPRANQFMIPPGEMSLNSKIVPVLEARGRKTGPWDPTLGALCWR